MKKPSLQKMAQIYELVTDYLGTILPHRETNFNTNHAASCLNGRNFHAFNTARRVNFIMSATFVCANCRMADCALRAFTPARDVIYWRTDTSRVCGRTGETIFHWG